MRVWCAPLHAPLPAHDEVVLVVAGVIRRRGRCLIGKRRKADSAGGLWEFPGGKIERGETPKEALRRELLEELALRVAVGPALGRALSQSPTRLLVLDLYGVECTDSQATPTALEHEELRWVEPKELFTVEWASADVPLLDCAFEFLCR